MTIETQRHSLSQSLYTQNRRRLASPRAVMAPRRRLSAALRLFIACVVAAGAYASAGQQAQRPEKHPVRLAHVDAATGDLVPDLDGLKRLAAVPEARPPKALEQEALSLSLFPTSTHSQQAVHLLAVFGPADSAGRRLALHSLGAPVDVDGHSAPGIWLWPAPSGTQTGEPQVLLLEGTYGSEPGSHAEAQARAGPTQCVFAGGGGCAPA
jgi:hypothetical protein